MFASDRRLWRNTDNDNNFIFHPYLKQPKASIVFYDCRDSINSIQKTIIINWKNKQRANNFINDDNDHSDDNDSNLDNDDDDRESHADNSESSRNA